MIEYDQPLTPETSVVEAQGQIAELVRSGHPHQAGPGSEQAKQKLLDAQISHENAMQTSVTGIADSLNGSADLFSEFVEPGDEAVFTAHAGLPDRSLQVDRVGLPELPSGITGLALLITESTAHKTGRKRTSISVVGMGPKRSDGRVDKKEYYIQNPTAAVGAVSKPVWVLGGSVQFGSELREVELSSRAGSIAKSRQPGNIKLKIGEAKYHDAGQETTTRLIRPRPNKLEYKPTAPEHKQAQKKQRLWRVLGTVAAGFMAVLPGVAQHEPVPIRSADEMIDLNGEYDQSIDYRAENLLQNSTLESMHKTFDAFFAGDRDALDQITENAGYKPNWLDAEIFDTLEYATNNEQLTTVFQHAIGTLPFALNLPSRPGSDSDGTHTYDVPSFEANKQGAAQLLESLNTFDHDMLDSVGPLTISFGTHLSAPDDTGNEKNLGGYYIEAFDGKPAEIVLGVEHTISNIFDHEFGHHFDDLQRLQVSISNLNPLAHQYVGDDFEKSRTHIGRNKVVAEAYGNKDAGEDTAVTFDTILSTDRKLEFTQSSFNEKQIFLLGEMEEKYPGFLANFLRQIQLPAEKGISVADIRNEAENKQTPLTGVGLLFLALSLNNELQKTKIKRLRSAHGLQ